MNTYVHSSIWLTALRWDLPVRAGQTHSCDGRSLVLRPFPPFGLIAGKSEPNKAAGSFRMPALFPSFFIRFR